MTRPKIVDPEALDLTLRALAVIDAPASAPEVSRVIREQFGATASTSRIYVAIGQLWERGHLTVSPVPVRRGSRHTKQTLVGITARGRAAVETLLDALDEEGRAERGRHARRERRG